MKEFFEELKHAVDPDLILTHTRHDRHQDHRVACELSWNTFRDHLVLEFEIPKYDGDLRPPNVVRSRRRGAGTPEGQLADGALCHAA